MIRFLWCLPFFIPLLVGAQCLSGKCSTGKGSYRFKDGSIYTGDFKNHQAHGQGSYRFANGNVYTGAWQYNLRHGNGIMNYVSGDRYEGAFSRNKFHGTGTYTFKDGKKYEGGWVNGKAHGKGTLVELGGKSISGYWANGKLQKKVDDLTDATPNLSTKKMKDCNTNFCSDETGFFHYPNGSVYEGNFFDGEPHGEGKCTYTNGDVYTGWWEKDQPNGMGHMRYHNGDVLNGYWVNGKFLRGERNLAANHLTKDNDAKIYAVLVGVSRYNKFPALKYTDDDAYRIYAFLKSPEGGALPDEQISILIDESATRKNILKQLHDVTERAGENDAVFCFFSGHGIDGHFLPIDSDGYRNALAYTEIKTILNESKAKQKLYVADACYSGSLVNSKTPLTQSMQMFYNKLNDSQGGTAFLLSSKREEFSLESMGLRQGVFSHYLIKGLKGSADRNSDRIVSVGELFNYVHNEVRSYTNNAQTPVIAGKFDQEMPLAMIR